MCKIRTKKRGKDREREIHLRTELLSQAEGRFALIIYRALVRRALFNSFQLYAVYTWQNPHVVMYRYFILFFSFYFFQTQFPRRVQRRFAQLSLLRLATEIRFRDWNVLNISVSFSNECYARFTL